MLNPFLTRSFLTSLILFCASAAFWGYQYHRVLDRQANQEANRISVSLDRLSQLDLNDTTKVCLEEHKQVGTGFWFENRDGISEFQTLTAVNEVESPSNADVAVSYTHLTLPTTPYV